MDQVSILIKSLSAPSEDSREAAVSQLVQTGIDAVPALLDVAENGDLVPRMHALIALAKIGAPAAIPLVHHALLGPRDIEAENAVCAAAEMRDETAVPLLQQLITHGNPPLPTTAAIAAGRISAPGAFEYLCHLPPNDDPGAQDGAIIALGALGDPRAVPVLLSVPSYRVDRPVVRAALRNIGEAAIPELIVALGQAHTAGEVAAEVLAEFGAIAEPALRGALDSPDKLAWSRAAAILGFLRLGDSELLLDMIAALDDPCDTPRRFAAEGLHFLADAFPDPELSLAIEPLRRCAAPWSFRTTATRTACRRALRQIQTAVKPLLALPVESTAPTTSFEQLPLAAGSPAPNGPLPVACDETAIVGVK